MLVVTRKPNEAVIITAGGERITIRVVAADGKVRLGVEAPKSIIVNREEVQSVIDKHQQPG
jgi:carbon storage regulator CsrA